MNTKAYFAALLGAALFGTASFGQVTYTDDFNRPDSADPGPDWTEIGGSWDIFQGHLRATSDNTNSRAARFEPLSLDGADEFSITGDIRSTSGGRWGGLAFHMQEGANTYYSIRIKHMDDPTAGAVQFISVTDGAAKALGSGSVNAGVNEYYRHEIVSTQPGEFQFSLYSLDTEGAVSGTLYSNTFSDTTFSGGYTGVHSGAHQILVDQFSATVIPEPATVGLLFAGAALGFVLIRRRLR